MTNIVIAGAAGRMGHALLAYSTKIEEITIVGAIERDGHPDLGKDSGTVAGLEPNGIALTTDLRAALLQADVVIDFTYHTSVPENAKLAAELSRAVVIGTTGLTAEETAVVEAAAFKVPILWAPNMSLGVNLLFAAVKKAATILGSEYAVSVEDVHHIHKTDAPSGTGLRLGEKIAEGANVPFEDVYVHDEGGQLTEIPKGKIVIQSHRRGEVIGDHTVRFASDEETVEFTHHAWSRECLAKGALKASIWVSNKRPRLYNMQDMLGLDD
jgi:4-hydroxy-tetrahydrodipicolinate reductase